MASNGLYSLGKTLLSKTSSTMSFKNSGYSRRSLLPVEVDRSSMRSRCFLETKARILLILNGLTILTLMISYTTVRVHALGRHSEVFRASTCHPVLHSGPMVPSKTALLFYPIAFYDRQLCGRGGGRYRKAEQV